MAKNMTKDDLDLIGEDEKPSKIVVSPADDENNTPLSNSKDDEEEEAPAPVQRIKENGRYSRKYAKASLGISPALLPPVTKHKTALYQATGTHDIDPLSGERVMDQSLSIAGSYIFYDPYEADLAKRNKKIRNVTGVHTEIIDKKEQLVERIDDIFFTNGFLLVNIEKNYPLFVFLELHPLNGSYRWRDKNIPVAFKRVDIAQRSISIRSAQMDLAMDAEKAVLEMKKDKLIGYANTAGINTMNRPVDEIRYDFRLFARNSPKSFFGMVPNNEAAVKMNVIDADAMGFIEFQSSRRGWVFLEEPQKPFYICGVAEEPTQGLIKYLARTDDAEAQTHYERILDLLKWWEE